jgi:hypothetical protein
MALAAALTIRAENAREKAGRMQPGGERVAAMNAAAILANAAELLTHFSTSAPRSSLPVK